MQTHESRSARLNSFVFHAIQWTVILVVAILLFLALAKNPGPESAMLKSISEKQCSAVLKMPCTILN